MWPPYSLRSSYLSQWINGREHGENMTQTVYKYPFQIADEVILGIPSDAQLLTVQMQNGQPCLWALVDPGNEIERRRLLVRGTGHDAEEIGRYISTFQMHGGALVFHVFEE